MAGVLATPDAIRSVATDAEDLGFDSVWVHDYIIWTKELDRLHISCGSREAVDAAGEDYPPIFYESLSNLAFLAGITKTIRLGVAVLCLPYRNPIVTAKQIATIDRLSGGRLELGIGPGAARRTHNVDPEVLGVSRATKYAQTTEYLQAMRCLWTEDSPAFDGRFVSFPAATVYPKPSQNPHPPIWIGGVSERSMEMVAQFADGWIPNWVTASAYPAAIADLRRRLAAYGRGPNDVVVGTEIQILIGDSDQDARQQAAKTMGVFQEGFGATGGVIDDGISDRSRRMWSSSLIGSSDSVRSEIGRYLEAGCTFFELKFIYRDLSHLAAQMREFRQTVSEQVPGLW